MDVSYIELNMLMNVPVNWYQVSLYICGYGRLFKATSSFPVLVHYRCHQGADRLRSLESIVLLNCSRYMPAMAWLWRKYTWTMFWIWLLGERALTSINSNCSSVTQWANDHTYGVCVTITMTRDHLRNIYADMALYCQWIVAQIYDYDSVMHKYVMNV